MLKARYVNENVGGAQKLIDSLFISQWNHEFACTSTLNRNVLSIGLLYPDDSFRMRLRNISPKRQLPSILGCISSGNNKFIRAYVVFGQFFEASSVRRWLQE